MSDIERKKKYRDNKYDSYAYSRADTSGGTSGGWAVASAPVLASENILLQENAELHKKVVKLEAVIEYLKSQNAFADTINRKKYEASVDDDKLPF